MVVNLGRKNEGLGGLEEELNEIYLIPMGTYFEYQI